MNVPRIGKTGHVVVAIEDDETRMIVDGAGETKAFAKQLIRDRKAFRCCPLPDEDAWEFVVSEENERGGVWQ